MKRRKDCCKVCARDMTGCAHHCWGKCAECQPCPRFRRKAKKARG